MSADTPKVAPTKAVAPSNKPEAKTSAAKKVATPKAAAEKSAAKKSAKSSAVVAAKKAPEVKKAKKEAKVKVVRDSFTMPQNEYQKIAGIKAACLETGLHVKKSEVLRAGLQALSAMSVTQLKAAIAKLDKVATGRPKKH